MIYLFFVYRLIEVSGILMNSKRLITRRKIKGVFAIGIAGAAVFCALAVMFIMIGTFLSQGVSHVSWSFLSEAPRNNNTEGGIFPAIYGTSLLVLIMTILGVPIGTVTAIYLHEYTNSASFVPKVIRFAVNTLAGVPSVVFGLFGLGFFVQFLGKGMDSMLGYTVTVWGQPALLWAAATLAVLTLPVVIVSVEEALRAVPREMREASIALGATKLQTIYKIVVPNAVTGILTGSILAVGRGAGEVAPILFTGAVYSLPELPTGVSSQFMHMGYHLLVLTTQSPDVDKTLPLQYATTLVMLGLTLSLNLGAILIRNRLRRSF
jgi:phosphate transport system permease protein